MLPGSDIATILFYCTLRECLLSSFLIKNLRTRKIDSLLIERLLDDNKLAHQKFNNLFCSVTGTKWDKALTAIHVRTGQDFKRVSQHMQEAAKLRNDFLHNGKFRYIDKSFSEACINTLGELFDLFAELHNEYNHPIIKQAL
ncbi:MAG: hypothetical protein B0A82_24845 [Alkalinema sp. CACIAM 70d]|nr:MAG: hypothetical protein B0A82_24845 [Alkalinema sp. CACIAM 70d]